MRHGLYEWVVMPIVHMNATDTFHANHEQPILRICWILEWQSFWMISLCTHVWLKEHFYITWNRVLECL